MKAPPNSWKSQSFWVAGEHPHSAHLKGPPRARPGRGLRTRTQSVSLLQLQPPKPSVLLSGEPASCAALRGLFFWKTSYASLKCEFYKVPEVQARPAYEKAIKTATRVQNRTHTQNRKHP